MNVGNLFGFKIKSAKNSVEHVDLVLSLKASAALLHVWIGSSTGIMSNTAMFRWKEIEGEQCDVLLFDLSAKTLLPRF
jgi:hypothetical protein